MAEAGPAWIALAGGPVDFIQDRLRTADPERLRFNILDWWHISMRVRHVEAAVQGLVQTKGFADNPVLFQRPAKSLRWWLWHGRARVAETYLKGLMQDCA
jgi:hypothetical protein